MVGAIARTFATPTSINFWLGITDLNPGKDQMVKIQCGPSMTSGKSIPCALCYNRRKKGIDLPRR